MKGIEDRISNEPAFAMHCGAAEPMTFQELSHLAITPLLKVETFQGIPEGPRDVVGARETVRGVKNIDSARAEEPVHGLEVERDVIGVKVFEKLVAEDHIGTAGGKVEMVPVVDDEFKVVGGDLTGGTLVGDVDAVNLFASRCRCKAETAVAGGELDEDGFGAVRGKVRTKEPQLLFTVLLG
jgi:hypothetical protein